MEFALIVFRQICIMALMVGVGFLLSHLSFVNMEGSRQMSIVLTKAVTSCLLFCSFLDVDANSENLQLLFIAWGLCLISHLIAIGLSRLLFHREGREESAVAKFAMTFTNNGFFGIPLVMAVCGSRGVFFASAGIMLSNALTWSYGVSLFEKQKKSTVRMLLNQPTLWAVFLGLIVFFLRMLLPAGLFTESQPFAALWAPVQTALKDLASMNTPLAMLVMGINLHNSGIKKAFVTKRCYLLAFFRQLLIPLLLLLVLWLLPIQDNDLRLTIYLITACPCALLTSILAVQYGNKKQQEEAAHTVVLSTLLTPLTVPLMVLIGSLVLGIS